MFQYLFFFKLLFVSSIFRKQSCENEETMADSSFDMDAVVLVFVDYISLVFVEGFPYFFPIVGSESLLSIS